MPHVVREKPGHSGFRTPFLDAYNFARRLKTLRGLTPCEAVYSAWADEPQHLIRPRPLDLGTEKS